MTAGSPVYSPPPPPEPAPGTTAEAAPLAAPAVNWPAVLASLEHDVSAAEDSLARGRADEIAAWGLRTQNWMPPSGLGPLPVDLRERAARLLQQQLAVAEALIERITQSQRQRDLAARMSYGPQRPEASYIDRAL